MGAVYGSRTVPLAHFRNEKKLLVSEKLNSTLSPIDINIKGQHVIHF
jgi:hypothetical protein